MLDSTRQNWPLVGRTEELNILNAAYASVQSGQGPKVVTLLAESGVGKTRLLVEFYGQLAQRAEADGYWPSALSPDARALPLNPTFDQFTWPEERRTLPSFWWWAIRCDDKSRRNSLGQCPAIQQAAPALLPHLGFLAYAKAIAADRRSTVDLLADAIIDWTGPLIEATVGQALPIGLAKTVMTKLHERRARAKEFQALKEANRELSAAADRHASKFHDELLEGLCAIARAKADDCTQAQQPRPLVVCVDDAHWLDAASLKLVSDLLLSASQERLPVLLLMTAWPKEWHDAIASPPSPEWQEFGALLASTGATEASLVGLDDVDRLIRLVSPGLIREQRLLIADKVGADLYALRLLLTAITQDPRRFTGKDVTKELTVEAQQWLADLPKGRQEIVKERFHSLSAEDRECASICALLGHDFVAQFAVDVLSAVKAEGWAELGTENPTLLVSRGMDKNFVWTRISNHVLSFVDAAVAELARAQISSSSQDVTRLRRSALLVLKSWITGSKFEDLSWPEVATFLEMGRWITLAIPGDAVNDAALREEIATALAAMHEIAQGRVPQELRALASAATETGSGVLDAASFRAGLSPRWQARWLLQRATDLRLRATAPSITHLEMRDAACGVVLQSVAAFKQHADWDAVEAICRAARAAVSMCWAAVQQSRKGIAPLAQATVMAPVRDVILGCTEALADMTSMSSTARIALLWNLSETNRGDSRAEISAVAQQLIEHINGNLLDDQSAQLLLRDVLPHVLISLAGSPPGIAVASSVRSAVLAHFGEVHLSKLGDFQLVSYAMALTHPRSHLRENDAAELGRRVEANRQLLSRGRGELVLDWTWHGYDFVAAARGLLSADPLQWPNRTGMVEDTWAAIDLCLRDLLDAEAGLPEAVFVTLCESTLSPLVEVLQSDSSSSFRSFDGFLRRAASVRPHAQRPLVVAAIRSWLHQARFTLSNTSRGDHALGIASAMNATAAMCMLGQRTQSLFGEQDLNLKVAEEANNVFAGITSCRERLRLVVSCLNPTLACLDLFPKHERGEVLHRALYQVHDTAMERHDFSPEFASFFEQVHRLIAAIDQTQPLQLAQLSDAVSNTKQFMADFGVMPFDQVS